ncbi:CHAT domain-containing protein [Candidatus Amarolinea aalborgensis]|uniref:CHAT domain-containing protein n=1 Tax=Candidatus Amarolinea aalborgensis TaxID=2249329 RepID=UPI003BFA08D1
MPPTRASSKPPHHLTLHLAADGRFTLASHSRLGGDAPRQPHPQPLPFDPAALAAIIASLDPATAGVAALDPAVLTALGRAGLLDSAGRPRADLAAEVGRRLWQSLLSDSEVAGLLRTDLANAQAAGEPLPLILTTGPNDTPLAALPWELLHDDDAFLLPPAQVAITRHISFARPTPVLRVRPPLRILLIEARPVGVPPLPPGQEATQLAVALAPLMEAGLVVLERLTPPTAKRLADRLADADNVQIIHFDGHGGFGALPAFAAAGASGRGSFLVFENDFCEPDPVDAGRLAAALNGRQVRLLYASACQTAQAGADSLFTGLGPGLLLAGIPAVVAMQFSVSVAAALAFMQRFYRSLAQGKALATCLADGRRVLFDPQHGLAWATPVLYLRDQDGDGQLFRLTA